MLGGWIKSFVVGRSKTVITGINDGHQSAILRQHIGSGSCSDWTTWSEFVHLGPDVYFIKWLFYVMWAVSTWNPCFSARVFMVSRLCLPQPVLIWSRNMHHTLLDPVFQKSSASLVSVYDNIILGSTINTTMLQLVLWWKVSSVDGH